MVRRITGTTCFASSLMMILWLATGATASGFVKFSLLGIVGSILALYKWDDLAAMMPSNRAVEVLDEGPADGIFGTDLPHEAFGEPVLETKTVNLSRSAEGFKPSEPFRSSVLVVEHEDPAEENANLFAQQPDLTEEFVPEPEPIHALAEPNETTELVTRTASSPAIVTSEPTFIELGGYSNDELLRSVRAGEASLVSVLTESGMLSTEGPVTDADVATMVFVAVSSDDLLRALLEGKEAEEQASALSTYSANTPELYEPAPQLVEPRG